MSVIRQLLGLNFLIREPWCFPETANSRVVIGNSKTLRRDSISKSAKFLIDKEIVSSALVNRAVPNIEIEGEKIPLHVKLRTEQLDTKTIFSRKRNPTRLNATPSSSNKLSNIFSLTGKINAEQALSVGYAAEELGIKYLRIVAPNGNDAVEQLRIVRTVASRFNLILIISVSNSDDLDFCLNWSDVIEIEVSRDLTKRELLRRVIESDKRLALRRCDKTTLDEFVRVTSAIQLESHKEFIIIENGTQNSSHKGTASFNVGMIQRLKEKTGAEVILDLTKENENAPLSVQLSGVASGINGMILQFDHTQATASYDELQSVVQKLDALKYTLDAISQWT